MSPSLSAVLLLLPLLGNPAPGATPAPSEKIYDEAADARKDVAAAAARAKAEGKRVLVTLGANWCPWCRRLEGLFRTDAEVRAVLEKGYVHVLVDVGRMTKNLDLAREWGADPKKDGLPLLVVLDGNGKAVKVQETGTLEEGKAHAPARVSGFLSAYAGP